MASIVNVVLPIFALILAGFICRRTNRIGEHASGELNRFVVWLALPALLFKVTATATWDEIWQPGFVATLCISTAIIFVITVWLRTTKEIKLVDACIDGLSASYANTGFLGIPLCLLVFGEKGLLPAVIATLIVACVLFAIGIILVEVSLQEERHPTKAFIKVSKALISNPLLVAPIIGGCWSATGATLNSAVFQFISLLGMAATPCALVSLGAFLAIRQSGHSEGAVGLIVAKLILQPAITGVLAFYVFELPVIWAKSALLLSALPTGTGPFMLASFYQREAALVSKVILFTTLLSVLSVSICLYSLGL